MTAKGKGQLETAGELKQVPIDSLLPWPRNYRNHTVGQIEKIAKSLKLHQQYRNVIIQAGTNRIIAGHGVWQAAKNNGSENILAMVLDVSDAEAEQILIDDNELQRFAEDDRYELAEILVGLREGEAAALSYDSDEIDGLLAELRPPEFPEYDESVADGMETVTCPKCGYEFPK